MEFLKVIISFYVFGALIFTAYNVLEISSLHKQHESSRDKNLKNSLIVLGNQHLSDIKSCWKWPVLVGQASVAALRWLKKQ